MSVSDKFLVAFLVVWNGLVTAFFLCHLQGWAWMFLAIEVVVGIAELTSKLVTGRTVTQKFRAFAATHLVHARALLIGLCVVWVLLLLHLAWR